MTTALSIIERACDLFGYRDPGEDLSMQDRAAFLAALNDMVDGWNTQRLFIVAVGEVVQTVSGLPITIGPGGTINVTRPTQMEDGAFIRQSGVDYPIKWITPDQYADIVMKSQAGVLAYVGNYEPAVPLGSIFLWPYPATAVELHLKLQTQLTEFAGIDTDYDLAPGYRKALAYSLAEELAPGKRELSPSVVRIAAAARRAIRRTNVVIEPQSLGSSGMTPLQQFISGL